MALTDAPGAVEADELDCLLSGLGEGPHWPPPPCTGSDGVLWHFVAKLDPPEVLHFGEVFAGEAAISKGMRALGFLGRSLDQSYHKSMDVLTPAGYLLWLNTALDVVPGGVFWRAPPCGTWVWMSRGTTKRHRQPEGDVLRAQVVAHNALVERLVLVLEILALRGVYWIIEQPTGTKMWEYPAVQACLQRQGAAEVCLEQGAYGAQSVKPTTLMGTAPWLHEMERKCTPGMRQELKESGACTTAKYTDKSGRKRCQGTPELKGTQAYPHGLGAQHARCFAAHWRAAPAALAQTGSSPRDAPALAQQGLSRADQVRVIQTQLPADVMASLKDAWWLRDFLEEPW